MRARPSTRIVTTAVLVITALVGVLVHAEQGAAARRPEIILELVVKSGSRAALESVADKLDFDITEELLTNRGLYAIEARPKTGPPNPNMAADRLVEKLQKESGILWAVPRSTSVDGARLYAWRLYAWPFAVPENGTGGFDLESALSLDAVHGIATGEGATVAILDTGFDLDHPELEDSLLEGFDLLDGDRRASDLRDAVDNDGDGLVDEAHGHGTFVAGIVNRVAPDADILPIRVLGADGVGEPYAVIEGIDTAIANGADVINLSFGGPDQIRALEDAIDRATQAGVTVVAAVGNDGSTRRRYPAASGGVLSVAAYDGSSGDIASFSTTGSWVDVSAPGVRIRSAKPGGSHRVWSGTSMAAPIVGAQAALLHELDPTRQPDEIEDIVEATADDAQGVDPPLIDILAALRS